MFWEPGGSRLGKRKAIVGSARTAPDISVLYTDSSINALAVEVQIVLANVSRKGSLSHMTIL